MSELTTTKRGRPQIYSFELASQLNGYIADGMSLRKACEQPGMPTKETVRSWLRDETKKDFLAQYTRAREEQADYWADEIIDQADKATDRESAAAAKVKVDARIWVASKLRPKRYGNTLDLTSGGKELPTPIMQIGTVNAIQVKDTNALRTDNSHEQD